MADKKRDRSDNIFFFFWCLTETDQMVYENVLEVDIEKVLGGKEKGSSLVEARPPGDKWLQTLCVSHVFDFSWKSVVVIPVIQHALISKHCAGEGAGKNTVYYAE